MGHLLSPRKSALQILSRIEQGGFSNLVLDARLEQGGLSRRDAALVTALVYTTVEKRDTLDYFIARFTKRGVGKMQPLLRNILRLGACQILYFEKIPVSAAVNESVKLAKSSGFSYASGFVNAVLRNLSRSTANLPYPDQAENPVRYLHIRYSCPEWMIKKWETAYGRENMLGILRSLDRHPPVVARVNTLKTTPEALIAALREEGIVAEPSKLLADAVELDRVPDLRSLEPFRAGMFILQDYASQLCCRALGARPGETVIDMCAAPGGKSFTLGFLMEGKGKIKSCELYESRLGLIGEGADRLGLSLIEPMQNDASKSNPALGLADRVLCDVPCSGLGVIRRKPEIKYKNPAELGSLPEIQYAILCEGARHVKPGGTLVYSTCTLNPDENEAVVSRFLKENLEFSAGRLPEPYRSDSFETTLFPHRDGTDGFFTARILRQSFSGVPARR